MKKRIIILGIVTLLGVGGIFYTLNHNKNLVAHRNEQQSLHVTATFEDTLEIPEYGKEEEKQAKLKYLKEYEISKVLIEIEGIQGAKVQLALSKEMKMGVEAASVMLDTIKQLDGEQIDSIVTVVQKSVKGLIKENIQVSDNKGNVLYVYSDNQ